MKFYPLIPLYDLSLPYSPCLQYITYRFAKPRQPGRPVGCFSVWLLTFFLTGTEGPASSYITADTALRTIRAT